MEDPTFQPKNMIDSTKDYLLGTAELYRLKAIDKVADGISIISVRIIVLPFIVLFFLIMNMAVALWLGEWLGRMSYGFFILGASYALIGLLIYFFGNSLIIAPLKNAFIKYALNIKLPWKILERPKN